MSDSSADLTTLMEIRPSVVACWLDVSGVAGKILMEGINTPLALGDSLTLPEKIWKNIKGRTGTTVGRTKQGTLKSQKMLAQK